MAVTLAAGTRLYRVASPRFGWPQVVDGQGANAPTFAGNRYNRRGERTVYAGDLDVVAAEQAFYAAADLQADASEYFRRHGAFAFPLRRDAALWCFDLAAAQTLTDVSDPAVVGPGGLPYPRFLLRMPSREYLATQELATSLRTAVPPADGVAAVSVRATPARHTLCRPQYAFFLPAGVAPLNAVLVQAWGVTVEFRDLAGQPANVATAQVDWANPFFYLWVCRHTLPAPAPQAPPGMSLGQWYQMTVNTS